MLKGSCCSCLLLSSCFCRCSKSGHLGLNWVWKVGMVFRSFLPMSNRQESIPLTKVWSDIQVWLTLCLSPFSVCSLLFGLLARLHHLTVGIWGCLGLFRIPFSSKMCVVSAVKRRSVVGSNFFRDVVSYKYCFETSNNFRCCLVFL